MNLRYWLRTGLRTYWEPNWAAERLIAPEVNGLEVSSARWLAENISMCRGNSL